MTSFLQTSADTHAGDPAASEAALELSGVGKQWPRAPKPVFEAVDLVLAPGEFAWLGGANGIGKTTLLRVAAGLLRADSGTVTAAGLDPHRDRLAFQRRMGFLSATSSGLYARLTVAQHLDYWARLALLTRERRSERVEAMVAAFDLAGLLKSRVDRISMGQRQRARLAGVFLHDPAVVLLDEPGNSLDGDARELLLATIEEMRTRRGAVLWCAPAGDASPPGVDSLHDLDAGGLTRR